ncbi:uncharacterized protein LOC114945710 [Nylanderia fulva]|uniref:uncharacterized protein LOC114945710 n=1 Tax=Nylanderia fulva TaxID=613905 RepID=UPI0010FBB764|nr:uncharacterized protein LOC114945710 [Nylanderia fulva]
MADRIIIEHSSESYSSTNSSDIEEEELDYENLFISESPIKGTLWLSDINKLKNLTFGTLERNVNQKNLIKEILKQFAKQSVYEDVRLFLLRHNFLNIATYFLTNPQPQLHETIYTLHIILKLCCIKKVIGDIGKSRSFVRSILLYLQNCKHEKILRKIIKLLQLATCEIQINFKSDWIVRFKECKFFGRRIMFLLESSQCRLGKLI